MEELHLPPLLSSMQIGSARLNEIHTVQSLLLAQNGTKLAFQKLPRHMRRRVMGHNTRRVPKLIRSIHRNQLVKSGLPPKQKRPSRKYRRRPKLLNDEITRRQRQYKWLETHIWHAKRFHMINKWAYKIPYRPTDKSFRACYRATAKHCLLQDVSYIGCIELKGNQLELINKFKVITRSNEGLLMHAIAYINGNREGRTTFYQSGSNVAIGSVNYHWKPNIDEKLATIWIWVHAAYFEEVLQELLTLFHLEKQANTTFVHKSKHIILTDLRVELNRFRLTGPLSQAVLNKGLKPVNVSIGIEPWLTEYLEDDEQRQIFSEQMDYWYSIKDLQSPSLISPHTIISLIVTDPRYNMPNKRTKAINVPVEVVKKTPYSKHMGLGPIWNAAFRNIVTGTKLSNATINDKRAQLLVPGSELHEQGAQVPILLIQRPGHDNSGFCAGWDIIIPKNWGQATWISLIMWGARAGGYRETENINFETASQPILPPDTKAGNEEDLLLEQTNRTRYFALPPNKRTNYNKFATVSPFNCNWKVLINDWSRSESVAHETYSVLRDKQLLQGLQLYLKNRKHKINIKQQNLLIPVKLTTKKGVLPRYSMICMPTKDSESSENLEPTKIDILKEERKKLRQEHKAILQKLKKKRHIARKEGHQVTLDKTINDAFRAKMRSLWIPEIQTDIRHSSSREIMGFVVNGGASFSKGSCHAIGYIPVTALKQFLTTMKGNQVLVRNTNCRQYRPATLEIIQ